MKLLVISQSRNRAGRTVQVRKEVHAEAVRVGRNAASDILLADPRIALSQGVIIDRDGLVYTEGDAGHPGGTAGKAARSERLAPGKAVDVGPYRLTATEPPEGYAGAITVELVRPAENVAPEFMARARRLTLSSLPISKRGLALALFAGIVVAFFLLPAARVLDLPWRAPQGVALASDRFWNPGPVMLAHQPIEAKCETCHQAAFTQVRDRACLECHSKIGQHVGPGMQPATLFGGTRCAQCHRDHKGVKTTHRDDDGFCIACHREVRTRASGAQSQDVADFARAHPPFRLSMHDGTRVRRVRQGGEPIEENSNLKFPHAVHLDAAGVKHPERGRIKLHCGACHLPDASERSFLPVSMARDCQACHRLEFEPAVSARQVPHGAPADAVTQVREFYANLALNGTRDSFEKAFGVPGVGLLRRPGEPTEAERRAAQAMAREKAERVAGELFGSRLASSGRKSERVADELFEVRLCATCHTVTRGAGGQEAVWKIAPVRQQHSWMPHARFDHRSHAQAKCVDCHDVARSKRSADVAMPGIEACRKCHGGSRPEERKITSSCLLCHGFHEEEHAWDAAFVPARAAAGSGLAK